MRRWAAAASIALLLLAVAAAAVTVFGHLAGGAEMVLRLAVLCGVALLGAFLPLSGALEELRYPRDSAALEIDTSYAKDDRFFALALQRAIEAGDAPPGLRMDPGTIDRGADVGEPVVASGDLSIGSAARVDAVKAAGTIRLGAATVVRRWIDSERSIHVAAGCDLGARATALESIQLGANVRFRLVSAPRILTRGAKSRAHAAGPDDAEQISSFASGRHRIRGDGALVVDAAFELPERARARGDLIVRGDVRLRAGAMVIGSIHSDGTISLERDAVVTRSVYAEGGVEVADGGAVGEHVVSRASVRLGRNVSVGAPDRMTTVLADDDVSIGPGVTVYGRVVAGQSGLTTA